MPKPLKILVDETSDGLDIKLQNAGYDAERNYVKKLRLQRRKIWKRLQHYEIRRRK